MKTNLTFKEVFFRILRWWRPILVTAIVFAIVMGAFGAVNAYRAIRSPEGVQAQKEDEAAYWTEKQRIEDAISTLITEIDNYREYIGDSLKMKLDPYNYTELTTILCVDSAEYRADGEQPLAITKAAWLAQLYCAAAGDSEFLTQLCEELDLKCDAKYLSEIIDVSNLEGLITVRVQFNDKLTAKEITSKITQHMQGQRNTFENLLGAHKLTVLSESAYHKLNTELRDFQAYQRSVYTSKQDNLTTLKSDLKEFRPPNPAGYILSGIKYAAAGGVAGAVICIAIVIILSLIGDKVIDEKDLLRRYDIKILASYNGERI